MKSRILATWRYVIYEWTLITIMLWKFYRKHVQYEKQQVSCHDTWSPWNGDAQYKCMCWFRNTSWKEPFKTYIELIQENNFIRKCSKLKAVNYRPISLLLLISKVFEKCIHDQLKISVTEFYIIYKFLDFDLIF